MQGGSEEAHGLTAEVRAIIIELLEDLEAEKAKSKRRRRGVTKTDYLARCVYLPVKARFKTLHDLPERENTGKAINDAMKAIEDENSDLRGVLPKTYARMENKPFENFSVS